MVLSSKPCHFGNASQKYMTAIVLFCCFLLSNVSAWSISATKPSNPALSRRQTLASILSFGTVALVPGRIVHAEEEASTLQEAVQSVQVVATGDAKKLFNEGRALEMQGNMAAAQRLYAKVTKVAPRFIYGWSNLGNTEVALGSLSGAEESYSKAITLCSENLKAEQQFGVPRCDDLYVLLLNRGALRLNNGSPNEALKDLQRANSLRGKPDAIVLENLARAKEINGLYSQADRDYTLAISMTSNEVSPFWLRSALVKYQLGDVKGGYDLLRRVENRFPEAPEVRAAYAVFLAATGDQVAAQRKYLEIPDKQRLRYVNNDYLTKTLSWPPAMIETLSKVTTAVGDAKSDA